MGCRLSTGSRNRYRGMVSRSASCSTSPTSSTGPSRVSKRFEPRLPARIRRPGSVPSIRQVEREVPRPGRNDQIPTRLPRRCRADHDRSEPSPSTTGGGTRSPSSRLEVEDGDVDRSLALPFSIIRRSVDVSQAGFSARAAGDREQAGRTELHVQFDRRHWNDSATARRTPIVVPKHVEVSRPRRSSGSSSTTRAARPGRVGSGTPTSRAQQFLAQIEPVLPGITQRWNGRRRSISDRLPGAGSYSYWKVGHTPGLPSRTAAEGNAHFCGEHTSIDFQGYLNGAVETGERAAEEVIADLG